MRTMADLEADAFKRDKGFLWRLALVMVAGSVAGLFMFGYLTGEGVAGCATRTLGDPTETPPNP